MINNNRQTLERENNSFIKIVFILIVSIVLMNIAMSISSSYGGGVSTVAGLFVLSIGCIICTKLIYSGLTNFQFKIIADELILERSIGRGNHIIIGVKFKDILKLEKCQDVYEKKDLRSIRKFAISRNIEDWYLLTYKVKDSEKKLVIEAKSVFLQTLKDRCTDE